jgi:hypothetical protein
MNIQRKQGRKTCSKNVVDISHRRKEEC